MTYARKVDANHAEVRTALRRLGWTVVDTSGLREFVDLVCCRRGVVELVEIKVKKGKPTPAQERLHANLLRAGVVVKMLRTVEDAVRL